MKLLVTRPAEDAAPLAAELRARGHEVLIAPMMTVSHRPERLPDLAAFSGLLFTSANGVRAFAKASPRRDLPAYAVGDHTAQTARDVGFTEVETAGGDSTTLVNLVKEKRKPEDGALLHVTGSDRAGDVAGDLKAAGFTVERALLYEAVPTESFATNVQEALAGNWLDGVLLFSPRTARLFTSLVSGKRLSGSTKRMTAWCLSPAVAEAIATLPIADKRVAASPTQEALLTLIGRVDPTAEPETSAPKEETAMAASSRAETAKKSWSARKRRRKYIAAAAIVVLVLVGGATSPFWAPGLGDILPWGAKAPAPDQMAASPPPDFMPPPPPPPSPWMNKGPSPGAIPAPDHLAPLPAANPPGLQALQDRVTALEAHPGAGSADMQAALADQRKLALTVADLSDKLAKLQDEVRTINRQAAADKALVLSMGQLHMALAGSGPYDAPLGLASGFASGDKALTGPLDTLKSHAHEGLPSLIMLRGQLEDVAEEASLPPPVSSDASWWRRSLDPMMRLVKVSRVPENGNTQALPPGPERSVATARAALDAGDLAGAVKAMRDLAHPGPKAKAWLADAQDRLDAENALTQADGEVAKRMTGSAGATP